MNKIVLFLLLSIITFPCFAGECDFIQLNACQSCDSLYSFPVGDSRACSFLCPNREANDFGSGSGSMQTNCALKRCPDTAPYQNEEGSCYKTKEVIFLKTRISYIQIGKRPAPKKINLSVGTAVVFPVIFLR